jgi:hypothetical protein
MSEADPAALRMEVSGSKSLLRQKSSRHGYRQNWRAGKRLFLEPAEGFELPTL